MSHTPETQERDRFGVLLVLLIDVVLIALTIDYVADLLAKIDAMQLDPVATQVAHWGVLGGVAVVILLVVLPSSPLNKLLEKFVSSAAKHNNLDVGV